MNAFPAFPYTDIKRKTVKPAIRASFDGGYEQTRPKFTRKIKEFSIEFGVLTLAQTEELDTFFIENQGLNFEFYDSIYGTTHIVRFSDDELIFSQISPTDNSVSLTLKEV